MDFDEFTVCKITETEERTRDVDMRSLCGCIQYTEICEIKTNKYSTKPRLDDYAVIAKARLFSRL